MAKKRDEQEKQEKVKCADCMNGKPHKGLAVWCIVLNTGRVANSLRFCDVFKRKL